MVAGMDVLAQFRSSAGKTAPPAIGGASRELVSLGPAPGTYIHGH